MGRAARVPLPIFIVTLDDRCSWRYGALARQMGRKIAMVESGQAGFEISVPVSGVCFSRRGDLARALALPLGDAPFGHLNCTTWRMIAQRKLAMWASQMRALDQIISARRDAVLAEDDVLYQPSLSGFAPRLRRVLSALRELPGWDMVYLGTCFEMLSAVTACARLEEGVGAGIGPEDGESSPLWLTRAGRPTCAHAVLYSQAGARKARALLASWGSKYRARTIAFGSEQPTTSTVNNGKSGKCHPSLRTPYHNFKRLFLGHDQVLQGAVMSGELLAFEVWPQLMVQKMHVNQSSHTYRGAIPESCNEAEEGTEALLWRAAG